MKQRTASRLAWSLWALTMLLLAANLVLSILNGTVGADIVFVILAVLTGTGYGTVGALIVSRHRQNAIGWIFLLIGLGVMLSIFGEEYPVYGLVTSPGSLPGTTFVLWFSTWILVPWIAAIPLVFLLFPTGRVHSRRWRPLVWVIVGGAALAVLGWIVKPGVISPHPEIAIENPTGIEGLGDVAGLLITVGGIPLAFAALASVVALFMRFRRATPEERRQIKWLAYLALLAGTLALATFLTGITLPEGEESTLNDVLFTLTIAAITAGIPAASGIAILKHRLYDIDVVVNKAVVYGSLAAFVTLVYVGIVVGVGALVGSRGNLLLSILATAVIALAFQPVRERARRFANRLVYGKRATPYEVMSEFADRVAGTYSLEDVLPRMARIAAEGTGAERVEVWVRVGEELRLEASWPAKTETRTIPLAGTAGLPSIPGAERAVPVAHQNETLGAIAVTMPRTEALTTAGEKLLSDLASQAGLVLRNVRLIEELRASRQRLVAAQDEERRRLERNIHDGAQQQLVALAVKLRLVETLAAKDAVKTQQMAAEAKAETQEALENLRDLARGIYPPLLADRGLAAALEAQARKAPVPVDVQPDGVGRYPQEAEAAAYFCVLEAIQNVAKYAEASRVTVRLRAENGTLMFTVEDDGRGFDPASTPRGSGLQNMQDRLEALGGHVDVRSSPGVGTTVTGRIPTGSSGPAPTPVP